MKLVHLQQERFTLENQANGRQKTPPLQDEKGRKLAENNAEPDGGYEYPEDIDYPYDEQFDEDSNDATRGLQESYYYYEYI